MRMHSSAPVAPAAPIPRRPRACSMPWSARARSPGARGGPTEIPPSTAGDGVQPAGVFHFPVLFQRLGQTRGRDFGGHHHYLPGGADQCDRAAAYGAPFPPPRARAHGVCARHIDVVLGALADTGQIMLLLILPLPMYLYYQAKGNWLDFGRQLRASWWLLAYLIAITILSWAGSKEFEGHDYIGYGWDQLSVAVTALIFYFWGLRRGWRTP